MNAMTYKGYAAAIVYSSEDDSLIGHLVGIRDVITFHGDSVDEIRQAFEKAVDFYLDNCSKSGREPQKPFSGRLSLRLPPELHANLAIQAETQGKSLNSLVVDTLAQASESQGL
ncbi:type II toxin-antitoxin system HicB family antitoxin [Deltaproteobacteria bacterium OttesenSCG-928-K17]|nr:type II toxin-antitoxin system HicB family antitoxin [Deltaproteobacteria bacterium OttesenSCG-928-K17]